MKSKLTKGINAFEIEKTYEKLYLLFVQKYQSNRGEYSFTTTSHS